MARVRHLQYIDTLTPDELRLAADAFDAALQEVTEISTSLPVVAIRRTVASFVMDAALWGERDPERLRAGALERLALLLTGVPDGNVQPKAADMGATRNAVYEARQVRDAEPAQPC